MLEFFSALIKEILLRFRDQEIISSLFQMITEMLSKELKRNQNILFHLKMKKLQLQGDLIQAYNETDLIL